MKTRSGRYLPSLTQEEHHKDAYQASESQPTDDDKYYDASECLVADVSYIPPTPKQTPKKQRYHVPKAQNLKQDDLYTSNQDFPTADAATPEQIKLPELHDRGVQRRRVVGKKWSQQELWALEQGLQEFLQMSHRPYADILEHPIYGKTLRDRTNVNLKDAARTLAKQRIRRGQDIGVFQYVCRKGAEGANHVSKRERAGNEQHTLDAPWTRNEFIALTRGMKRYFFKSSQPYQKIVLDPEFAQTLRFRTCCDLRAKVKQEFQYRRVHAPELVGLFIHADEY